MATCSILSFFSTLPIFLFLLCVPHVAIAELSSSSVALSQLNFWSKNVVNSMPEALVSKLSPLSNQECVSLAYSSVSESSSEAKLCSMANLACAALSSAIAPPTKFGYNCYISCSAPHLEDVDPNSFFKLSALQTGKKIQLPNLNDHFPSRTFLPLQIASKISITRSTHDLRKFFPSSFTSPASEKTMKMSISHCSSPSLKGEIKSCLNSLENMIEFSKKALRVTKLMSLTTKSIKGSKKVVEIGNIKQFHAEKVVSCHEVFFPFATYFCHRLSSTRLYVVDVVEPTTKTPINNIVAVCHMDTSEWPADHVSFKILNLSPGQGEACHWFTKVDLAWIGKNIN